MKKYVLMFAGLLATLPMSAYVAASKAKILIDKKDASVVNVAAEALSNDIRMVLGQGSNAVSGGQEKVLPKVLSKPDGTRQMIIAGTLGQSTYIDRLAKKGEIDAKAIRGKWEAYGLQTVKKPMRGVDEALVVYGSDPRGTAYGIFEISRKLGVSPWVWWADVTPALREEVVLDIDKMVEDGPDVQYRGIFINDEDNGFRPWAAKMQDPDVKNCGPNAYAKVFELLLRLRANTLWPAMHPGSKSFWLFKGNPEMARKYDIVIGSSHCEPLLTNSAAEWKKNMGAYNFATNKEGVMRYLGKRVSESKGMDNIYTMGMRGIHDLPIQGYKTTEDKVKGLTDIISSERKMLMDSINSDITKIPQMFCPYKEVLEAYNAGLKVPDDIMMCWVNDNHGYIRQLPNRQEQARSGGNGIYYHLSYWGAPKQWTWLSTISPSLVAFEMQKAYAMNVRRMWIVNVGDIKPAEAETEFFLDMAWNAKKWNAENAWKFAYRWAEETFGNGCQGRDSSTTSECSISAIAKVIGDIKAEYYRLAASGKPEHINLIVYSQNEINQRLSDYADLVKKVDEVKKLVPARLQDAFFELVEYPVKGAAAMNEKILKERMAKVAMLSAQHAIAIDSAGLYGKEARQAHLEIQGLTKRYNKVIAHGKWDGMMGIGARWRPEFKAPFDDSTKVKQEATVYTIPRREAKVYRASQYLRKSDNVKLLKGLGATGEALAVYSLQEKDSLKGNPFASPIYNKVEEAPYVEYVLDAKYGENQITVMFVPSFPLNKDYKLRYAISIDGAKPITKSIASTVGDETWSKNVLMGYTQSSTTKWQAQNDAEVKVRIYLLDPGVAIEGIKIQYDDKAKNFKDQSPIRIARFYGNRLGAVSYTFDDGLLEQYTELFPMMKRLGLKGSFCVNGRTINNAKPTDEKPRMTWAMMKEMSKNGQEISSHGWAHTSIKRISGEALRYEVQHNDTCIYEHIGKFPRTYFYPGNAKNEEGVAFASKDRVGTRTFQISIGSKRNAEWLHRWVRELIRDRKWGVGMTHGISRGYDHFPKPQVFFDHLADAAKLQDSLWIATFHDASAYIAERDAVSLDIRHNGKVTEVTPSLALDSKIFVMPLSLIVPKNVKKVVQDGKRLKLKQQNGEKYVDINPFGGKIFLTE